MRGREAKSARTCIGSLSSLTSGLLLLGIMVQVVLGVTLFRELILLRGRLGIVMPIFCLFAVDCAMPSPNSVKQSRYSAGSPVLHRAIQALTLVAQVLLCNVEVLLHGVPVVLQKTVLE